MENRLDINYNFIYDDFIRIEKVDHELSDRRIVTVLHWIKEDNTFIITDTNGYILGNGKSTWYGYSSSYNDNHEFYFMG